eukprot:CAMPEP_0197297788 /NCGR_PEP_ID=MMETSP0890-20130614/41995_1 /TAXON_ID=44058 ORGANISM="Aureoumbra lagunensis, Strain CCMP1510" /NCGR_SAMPLE_ID=MMETSP0890 /ASSEMBLY_ACC=CAM_ASM_000533 /LENGTH=257 /DNA_ID=CAMNT_0042775139 /DNA_START=596 /DNA_END=1369 /DNA_ORIENTATION=-
MCQACSNYQEVEDKSSMNKYCRAVLTYYEYSFAAAQFFLSDLKDDTGASFWCQPETLRNIADGSFSDSFITKKEESSTFSYETTDKAIESCDMISTCVTHNTPVLGGADVVAYHFLQDESAPAVHGRPEFTALLDGYEFWFASKHNLDIFLARPKSFAPQLGGFCALGLSGSDPMLLREPSPKSLDRVPVDVNVWHLEEGKLYLFRGAGAKRIFFDTLHAPYVNSEKNWDTLRIAAECLPSDEAPLFNTNCLYLSDD